MKNRILISFCLLFINYYALSQDVIIRGTIIEKSNGEAILNQKVKLLRGTDSSVIAGAYTDENGFFSILK